MLGTNDRPGIMPRVIHELLNIVSNDSENAYQIKLSYLEIYNENLKDLLNPTSTAEIDIREDPERGTFLSGVTEVYTTSLDDTIGLLK
jgi:kinesin family protein 18/19